MNPSHILAEAPVRKHRGRLQLLLIVGIVFLPMILATAMYKLQFWVPQGRIYHGELIANGLSRADIGVQSEENRWQILVTSPAVCEADCQQLVYLARQVQIALGRDAGRASHALATAQSLPAEFAALLDRDYPRLARLPLDLGAHKPQGLAPHLWIVDPHGNLVLRYDKGLNGKDLLKDLRQLLKLSNIG